MVPGEPPRKRPRSLQHLSPIVQAIGEAEKHTTGEIRVHLSSRLLEPDAFKRAWKLFHQYGMMITSQRNAVLIYVNLRRRRFAIAADEGIARKVGPRYWDELAALLREDLMSTHPENAIALCVATLGVTLRTHFPAGLDSGA